jgi:SagB-type dehydrogenase family enzyme
MKEGFGERFQQQSKLRRGDTFPPGRHVPIFKVYATPLETVRLAAPEHKRGPGLWSVLTARRSLAPEIGASITPAELGQVLWAAHGVSALAKQPGELPTRTIPSASGSHPIEAYVVGDKIRDTFAGIYHYSVTEHQLEQVKSGAFLDDLQSILLNQPGVEFVACAIVLTGVVERVTASHGERGYRYLYIEVGHAVQNIQLAATALGLLAQPVVTFFDDELGYLLGLPLKKEVPLVVVLLGR